MIINNKNELAITALRREALDIIEAGIKRILPPNIMKASIKYDAKRRILKIINDECYYLVKGRIFVIGGGKASGLMAETLENIIGVENIAAGVVNCNSADYKTSKIKVIEAGHPIPDERGLDGVREMLALRERYQINGNDLIICLISGGGSALLPCPIDEISLEDKQRITELLLKCGAEIGEINALRKHLSKIKGGRLGNFYSPVRVISLILSDVIDNNLQVIASGPTFPDTSTYLDAYNVLRKYGLVLRAPKSITSFLERGCRGEAAETPKKLANCKNYIIGDNRLALEAMAGKAKGMRLTPYIVTAEQKGDTTTMAELRANELLNAKYAGYNAILVGGETTPKIPDTAGKGGRNQHYASVSLLAMSKYPGEWVLASIGTDGSDFLPNIAGAIVDNNSLHIAQAKGINVKAYLDRYDSFNLLEAIGNSLIITGDTGTNVGDVMVYVLG